MQEACLEYETFKDVYASIKPTLPADLKVNEVLSFLINKRMASGLPNLVVLYKIFLTLSVTSTAAERSFSGLKLTKNYLRSTMTNDGLSGLAMLYIERKLANDIDYQSTITRFATMKTRRAKFL